jgi:hypothetical protein
VFLLFCVLVLSFLFGVLTQPLRLGENAEVGFAEALKIVFSPYIAVEGVGDGDGDGDGLGDEHKNNWRRE